MTAGSSGRRSCSRSGRDRGIRTEVRRLACDSLEASLPVPVPDDERELELLQELARPGSPSTAPACSSRVAGAPPPLPDRRRLVAAFEENEHVTTLTLMSRGHRTPFGPSPNARIGRMWSSSSLVWTAGARCSRAARSLSLERVVEPPSVGGPPGLFQLPPLPRRRSVRHRRRHRAVAPR